MQEETYRRWTVQKTLLLAVLFLGLCSPLVIYLIETPFGKVPDRYTDVQFILNEHCVTCHGSAATASGRFRATSHSEVMNRVPRVVAPGDPSGSILSRVLHHEGKIHMPPGRSLTRKEVAVVDAWIAAGAKP